MRWEHPLLLADSQVESLWKELRPRQHVVILGLGFDPRSTIILERMADATGDRFDAIVVELPPDEGTDAALSRMVEKNRQRTVDVMRRVNGRIHWLQTEAAHDNRARGRLVSREFQRRAYLNQYHTVTVEVSAMPRSIYFPVIRGILERAHVSRLDGELWRGDLHVAVCEDPDVDRRIVHEGTTPMAPIGGFQPVGIDEACATIWVPVVGERAEDHLVRLFNELEPDQVCPVLPWPAHSPRRGDDLYLKLSSLLLETMNSDSGDIIYAAERNPFHLYRSIYRLRSKYLDALRPLGDAVLVLSSHSSKLLSIGVLLAAYDFELGVVHAGPDRYGLQDPGLGSLDNVIYDLWLTGEPYEP